ncbi:MAG: hypothetical protein JO366_03220 [Methylobacteriaceae bacterium]|nr:hypothetical protein [Methylobacteriaceae bacterium]MBV9243803.1 hypothetical protein [Methylobacteriaceae bacterium]MBV9636989.1 hypothetical protein [Methylobacteriaceae bacterium]MBV9702484.1 hypothetical protein [Methylobacteriaceae bacterium]
MDRNILVRHLTQAEDHVAKGKRHLQQQREIVAKLNGEGGGSTRAQRLLNLFEEMQALHVADRERLKKALAEAANP